MVNEWGVNIILKSGHTPRNWIGCSNSCGFEFKRVEHILTGVHCSLLWSHLCANYHHFWNMFHQKKRSMYRWWSWPVRDHGPAASPQLLLLRPLRLLGTWLWSQGKTSSPKSSFYKSSTAINHVGYPIFQTTSRIPTKNKEIPSAEPMKDAIATWSGAWIKSVKKLHGWYLHVQKSVSLIQVSPIHNHVQKGYP